MIYTKRHDIDNIKDYHTACDPDKVKEFGSQDQKTVFTNREPQF